MEGEVQDILWANLSTGQSKARYGLDPGGFTLRGLIWICPRGKQSETQWTSR